MNSLLAEDSNSSLSAGVKLIKSLNLPWSQFASTAWDTIWKAISSKLAEGMYEVLEYETTIELLDPRGEQATVHKREKVSYLQNHITTFQDQAWGDGKILVDYRCAPGIPVDRYRLGYQTHILISLRDVKNRGDRDEFNIEWGIRNGFLRPTGFWATEINHRTRQVKVQVIFPKTRPPIEAVVVEKNRKRTLMLGKDCINSLPDERRCITWVLPHPVLNEQYILKWNW